MGRGSRLAGASWLVLSLFVAGCSQSVAATTIPPDPLRAEGTITARQLLARLLEDYKLNRDAQLEEPARSGYRFGNLDTVLYVFRTSAGRVYVDNAGGGMAWSESCEAMDLFVEANRWSHGSGCLDE